MRVYIYVTKFYNWDPVPKGAVITEQDIASGLVMPGRDGGYRMRVVKVPVGGTVKTCHITESLIIEKIIEEKADVRKAGRTHSRKDALAHLIADQFLPGEIEWDWITKIEVHDDGPDEALVRAKLEPHTKAEHGRRPGRKNIPAEHVDNHVAAYMAPCSAAELADHLHQHFGVKVPS